MLLILTYNLIISHTTRIRWTRRSTARQARTPSTRRMFDTTKRPLYYTVGLLHVLYSARMFSPLCQAEELGKEAYDIATSEQAKEVYKETGNFVVQAWQHTVPVLEKAGRNVTEFFWKVTDDILSGNNVKRGEPDVLLVEWRPPPLAFSTTSS